MNLIRLAQSGDDFAVAAAATVVLSWTGLDGQNLVSVEIENTGAAALVGAKLQRQLHPDGEWKDFFGDTDFDSITNNNLEFVSSDKPHTLAAAGKADCGVSVKGATAVRLVLTADVGGTTVVARGNMQKA